MDAKGAERPAFSAFWATKPMGQMQKKKKKKKTTYYHTGM